MHPERLGVDAPKKKDCARWKPDIEKQNTVPLKSTARPTITHSKTKSGPIRPDRTPLNCPNTRDNGPLKTPL